MRKMKDSNIKWIGQIPEDWKICHLKYLLSNNDGGVWGDDPNDDNDKIVLRSTEQTIDGKWQLDDPAKRNLKGIKGLNNFKIKQDDLLITKSSGSTLHIGKTTLVEDINELGECYYSNFLQRLHTKTELLPKFLWYLMNNPIVREQFVYLQNSTIGIGNINSNNIDNIYIAYPDCKIQQKIADFLDEKCSEIDALHDDIEKQIEILEEYKKSVIYEAVTKGLDKTVEMKDSGIEWCQNIPTHWAVKPNKYIMYKKKDICSVYEGEDILSLTMDGVIVRDLDAGGKMPSSFDGYQIIHPNNLLMCLFDYDVTPRCIGLIKNEGLTSPAYSQFVMKDDNVSDYYYYYYLMIDHTKELLHLAKNLRHSFTEDQLGAINVPVPPIEEQKDIAQFLNNKCNEIDLAIKDKQEQLLTLEEYKKSLIYEYVTGKKEV